MQASYVAVTDNAAKTLNLEGYGIVKGCNVDLVVLQARDTISALRLRPARLMVMRRGRVISTTPAKVSRVDLGAEVVGVDYVL